ncbi:MAG: hypothetical protein BWY45_03399 [Euryarchaeota archaeon ADurb.Bin294]|nr:MAG: hypothetical protein BWY45_03399 [Euryarchaeota archaeon ADurb.Bin294]
MTLGIQLAWGSFSSLVSSSVTILANGGINKEIAFSEVVFPDAVPPAKMHDFPFSTASQRNAIERGEKVPHSIRSVGVIGSSLNFLMVKVDPCAVTSVPSVI